MKKKDKEQFIIEAKQIHGELYDYSKVDYVNSKTKICIIDPEYGEFWQTPVAHISQKRGSPYRKIERFKQTNLERYGVENPQQNKEIQQKTRNTNLKKYGTESPLLSTDIKEKIKQTNIKRYGTHNNFIWQKETIKKTNIKRYGVENPFQSDEIKEKIKETNLERYGVENPQQNKEIQQKTRNTNLDKFGYEYASQSEETKEKIKQKTLEKYGVLYHNQKHLSKDFIEIFGNKELLIQFMQDKTAYEASQISGYSLSAIHRKCLYYNIPYIKNEPQWEIELSNLLLENNIVHIRNDRQQIYPQELDFYLPDHKIAIELNGLYWHSEKYRNKNYHYEKYSLCKSKNIQLIQIFEDEWFYKREAIINSIKQKLGINTKKYMARKCIIKEVDVLTAKQFLNNYHHQGFVASSYYIALFNNEELVAMMTFKNNELTRFCTNGSSISGGASKLLKYFINKHNPSKIITFSDNRWSNGNLYHKLGFSIDCHILPDYSYIFGNTRSHKFNHRKQKYKHKYDISSLTEKQIMKKENILRIYDAGKIRFIMNIA